MKSNSKRKGVLTTALTRRQEAFKGGMIAFRFPNDGKRPETEKKRRLRMPKNNLRKIACATVYTASRTTPIVTDREGITIVPNGSEKYCF